MTNNHDGRGWGARFLPLAATLLCLAAVDARAIEFGDEGYDGSFDTTLSYGLSWRVVDRDQAIIGIPNGGTAFSVNGDDGNLNFDQGLVSNAAKVTSELELDYDRWGAFLRGTAFYDYEIQKNERDRTPLSQDAKDLVGSDAKFLDAYLWSQFDVADKPGEVRLGNQVLSWGESTFIQNSINTINPVDVSQIRVPGAELREALEPIPMLSASLEVTDNTGFEVFYQIDWEETVIDPPGSYFSTNDFAGDGGTRVQLGFGGVPEGPFLGVSRDPELQKDPEDEGQFGLAYRVFVPSWNDTELGFYYIRYHSRLPIISARTGTNAGLQAAGTVYADAGVAPGTNALVDAIATDAYARTAGYFIEYPEDIDLFGISFNTQLGTSGIAFQGEVSHRIDVPLQVDDVELLFAALSPFNPAFDASQVNSFFGQDYGTNQVISGFIKRDVTQVQFTGTRVFSQLLNAEQLALVGEIGYTHVHDFPNTDELRMESPGTYLSGNETLASTQGPGAGQFEPASAFADKDSWGYRLLARLTYNNALGSANLSPRIAWSEDVKGNSPGPGGNFLEGRRALTLGLGLDYQNQWSGDLSYTAFSGAGRYNLINDRDFVAINAKFSF